MQLTGYFGKSDTRTQIYVGVCDAPWPLRISRKYPDILGLPASWLPAYARESAIAGKPEAMITLVSANGRIKGFFDIHHPAMRNSLDGARLAEAASDVCAPHDTMGLASGWRTLRCRS